MEYEELQGLVNNPAELITKLLKNFKPLFEVEAYKDYDVLFHKINQKRHRPDKVVKKPTGQKTTEGEPILEDALVKVNRIAIPFQKLIVETSATFLTGGTIDLKATPTDGTKEQGMFDGVKLLWRKNKLQFKTGQIAEYMMSQLECAELWFSDVTIVKQADGSDKEVTTMKMNVLAPSFGYQLQPVFDGINNMIAFGVYYTKDKVKYYDLYTDTHIRKFQSVKSGEWSLIGDGTDTGGGVIEIPYGKIPIIYYSQPRSEWYDVQSMIERLETMQSNHGDTNDYSGSPILFVKGTITGFADKGEPGKIIQGDANTDMSYVTPDQAPESMTAEYKNLKSLIHLCTAVPDLSLEALSGLGQVPSGAAFERLLIATYMKAIRRQVGSFGESVQRRVNFLQAACAAIDKTLMPVVDMDISIKFNLFKLDDLLDTITAWMAANGGSPLISEEESVAAAGLTDDPEATYAKIKAEKAALGNIINPPSNQ